VLHSLTSGDATGEAHGLHARGALLHSLPPSTNPRPPPPPPPPPPPILIDKVEEEAYTTVGGAVSGCVHVGVCTCVCRRYTCCKQAASLRVATA